MNELEILYWVILSFAGLAMAVGFLGLATMR